MIFLKELMIPNNNFKKKSVYGKKCYSYKWQGTENSNKITILLVIHVYCLLLSICYKS